MSKKHLFLIGVLLGIVVFVVGCGGGRDLSKPSTRLVGHWGYYDQYDQGESGFHVMELYFGQIDEEGFGSCVFWLKPPAYNIEEDWIIYGNYHIISENGNNVAFNCFEGDEVNDFFGGTYEVTEDGQFLKDVDTQVDDQFIDQFQYIDSKSEP